MTVTRLAMSASGLLLVQLLQQETSRLVQNFAMVDSESPSLANYTLFKVYCKP